MFLKLVKLEASRRPLFSLDHISVRMFSIANGAETCDKVITGVNAQNPCERIRWKHYLAQDHT